MSEDGLHGVGLIQVASALSGIDFHKGCLTVDVNVVVNL